MNIYSGYNPSSIEFDPFNGKYGGTTNPVCPDTPQPTSDPTVNPTDRPTESPSTDPTHDPTADPSVDPTANPTTNPTHNPTDDPTTSAPTTDPTKDPTTEPTVDPTKDPTKDPSTDPTSDPTVDPTGAPSEATPSPTDPTSLPTTDPTSNPTETAEVDCIQSQLCECTSNPDECIFNCEGAGKCAGTQLSTAYNGQAITVNCVGSSACFGLIGDLSSAASVTWNCEGSNACKNAYLDQCASTCDLNCACQSDCSNENSCGADYTTLINGAFTSCSGIFCLTSDPTSDPTIDPTKDPTGNPTTDPTKDPTGDPTIDPTRDPTSDPTENPTTSAPSMSPTESTSDPTHDPTIDPTADPTHDPTTHPTADPTNEPTTDPTTDPTAVPSYDPTMHPSTDPTVDPTGNPTDNPVAGTNNPSAAPTTETDAPTYDPTNNPTTDNPTNNPTPQPTSTTMTPTEYPTEAMQESIFIIITLNFDFQDIEDRVDEIGSTLESWALRIIRDLIDLVDGFSINIISVYSGSVVIDFEVQSPDTFILDQAKQDINDATIIHDPIFNLTFPITSIREYTSEPTTDPTEYPTPRPTELNYEGRLKLYTPELDGLTDLYETVAGSFTGGMAFIALIGLIDAKAIRKNDYFRIGALLSFYMQTMDMISDCFFVASIHVQNKIELDDAYTIIFYLSILFIVVPAMTALFQLYFYARRKWLENDHTRAWLSKFSTLLLLLSVVTGSSFAATSLLNSYLFQLDLLDMGLTQKQLKGFNTKRVYSIVILEVCLISYEQTSIL